MCFGKDFLLSCLFTPGPPLALRRLLPAAPPPRPRPARPSPPPPPPPATARPHPLPDPRSRPAHSLLNRLSGFLQRSEKPEPASTDASWFRSPRRIRRVCSPVWASSRYIS